MSLISPLSMSIVKMSSTALRRPANATVLPSGLMSGDSGMSTGLISNRFLLLHRFANLAIEVFLEHQLLGFLLAGKEGEPIARGRPSHPGDRVAAEATG